MYWSSKALDQLDQLNERQKDSDNQRLSQERGRSNYGKASIRNMRASGKGGNAADPAERLVAMDARHKAHKEKRGVKTKGKSNLGEEGYDQIKDRIAMAGGDPSSPKKMDATKYPVSKEIRNQKGKTVLQKQSEKKYGKGATALDIVKKKITAKHGKGAIMNTKKK